MKTAVKVVSISTAGFIVFLGTALVGVQQIAESKYRPALAIELDEGLLAAATSTQKLRLRHIRFEIKDSRSYLTTIIIRLTDPDVTTEARGYLITEKVRIEGVLEILDEEKDCILSGNTNCS